MNRFVILLINIFFILESCGLQNPEIDNNKEYNLSQPDSIFHLPHELKEISGIAYTDKNIIAAIQDERGTIFFYSLEDRKIINRIHFSERGDFEGITSTPEGYFIIRSDGVIISYTSKGSETIQTGIASKENAEGIAYDKNRRSILIACKNTQRILSFDLKAEILNPDWEINLSKEQISPSGIAIHPNTNDLYVLSDNKVLVLDSSGTVKERFFLNPSLFPNPEGITISPEGDLYLSNEGNGNEGTILLFKKQSVQGKTISHIIHPVHNFFLQ